MDPKTDIEMNPLVPQVSQSKINTTTIASDNNIDFDNDPEGKNSISTASQLRGKSVTFNASVINKELAKESETNFQSNRHQKRLSRRMSFTAVFKKMESQDGTIDINHLEKEVNDEKVKSFHVS